MTMHSFYFGGTESDPTGTSAVYFGGQSYGVTLNMEEFDGLTSVMVDAQDVPYGYGGVSWGAHHPVKMFRLPCLLRGTSQSDTQSKIDAINHALDINRLGALRFDDWNDRYWLVRFSGRSQVKLYQMGATFDLEFIAPDPRAYSTTETTQTVSLTTGTNSFSVPASGVLSGTAETDVTWIVKPTGSGATSPVVLANVTRDETLSWYAPLTSAQWLKVTSSARSEKCERTGDSGATYTAMNYSIFSGSRFPKLSPAVANSCTLSGIASTGSLVITYRARYN